RRGAAPGSKERAYRRHHRRVRRLRADRRGCPKCSITQITSSMRMFGWPLSNSRTRAAGTAMSADPTAHRPAHHVGTIEAQVVEHIVEPGAVVIPPPRIPSGISQLALADVTDGVHRVDPSLPVSASMIDSHHRAA